MVVTNMAVQNVLMDNILLEIQKNVIFAKYRIKNIYQIINQLVLIVIKNV